jgi:ABC-type sugar transport system permease subunit
MKRRIRIALYSIPALLLICLVFVYPVIQVFQYSFSRVKPRELIYIGLENYKILFSDTTFYISLKNNFLLLLVVPILIILSLFFAILLYEKIWGWKFYRFTLFLPYIIAIPVAGIVLAYVFRWDGILNNFLQIIGLDFLAKDWLGSPRLVIWTIALVIIWKELGFGIIILFARMLTINRDLYESAELDGSNWLQKHIHITIPEIRSTILFLTVIYIITILSWVFSYIFVMTKGGPNVASIVIEYYIYLNAFTYDNKGLASAGAVILFLIVLFFIFLMNKVIIKEGNE